MQAADKQVQCDVAILGGGIAGLWLLNLLETRGYRVLLVEKSSLGCQQTLASQGMIHGGIKYTLSGGLTGASETIRDMPSRWQNCLEGNNEATLDLSGVLLLSNDYYLFSDASLSSRVTAFFGSKAIEGRVEPLSRADYPEALNDPAFRGALYRLQDVVIDTGSLINVLAANPAGRILKGDATIETDGGNISRLRIGEIVVEAGTYILAAGEGNGPLLEQLGSDIRMQIRPLHQSVVAGNLPSLYAHAVSLRAGDKPRLTVTTHPGDKENIWYLGGQLAETGVARSEAEQIDFTRRELADIFPWMDFSACRFSTLRINRAEPSQDDAGRPDTPFVAKRGNVITCWPTKLTLTPLMGDMLLPELPEPTGQLSPVPVDTEVAVVGQPPWATP